MYRSTWLSIFSPNSDSVTPSIHGGDGAAGGGLVALIDQLLAQLTHFLESGPSSFQLLPGIAGLGYNVHPLIVHFPIAFLLGFFVLEWVSLSRSQQNLRIATSWMLYLGAAGAILAATAGLIAEARVPHGNEVHDIMEWHGRLGLTVATLSTTLALWRIIVQSRFASVMARSLYLGLATVMTVCLLIGADLGGLMVYQHGVGVKQLQHPDAHHHDQDAAGKTQG